MAVATAVATADNKVVPVFGCRSLKPAQDAASVLQRYVEANPSRQITDLDSETNGNPQDEEVDENLQEHRSGA